MPSVVSVVAALMFPLLAGPIGPPVSDDPVAVNLDRDGRSEQLLSHERPSDQLVQAQVRDRCRDGRRTWHLSPYEDKFNAIEAVEADATTRQRDVFFSATGPSSALTDRLVKLVRFDRRGGACARPHTLLRYRPHPARRGRGTTVVGARAIDVDPQRDGLEIRLRLVTFAHRNGQPRVVRRHTRIYAYDRGRDRYVILRTSR